MVVNDEVVGVLAESLHLVIDQWIQYKLGKQYDAVSDLMHN